MAVDGDSSVESASVASAPAVARWLDTFSEWTGRTIAWLTLAMVLIMFGIVVARYGFDLGSIALQESISYLHSIVFLLGAAYTLKHDQHVRVDIFYKRWSPRRRAWIDALGVLLLLLPTCGFIFWISLDYVASAWAIAEGSREAGGLRYVYLLKALIPLTAALLALQGVALLLKRIDQLRPAKQ